MSSFRWLHLTDLHCGQSGQRHLWPEIRHRFFEDLEKLVAMCGPWQAVLFSGDLVQRGEAQEFEQLEQQVLGPLWEKFAQLGCQPVLLTVPGNHDLQRPGNGIRKSLKPALQWLLKSELFPKIADELFNKLDSPYRKIIDKTLANYMKWTAEQRHRQAHPIATNSFPGDFSTKFNVSDRYSVGVLGLNTTFLQLDAGDYQGRLAWDVRQFHAVCEGDGPKWAKQHDVCLLMTHQGPEWLNDASRKKVYPEINPAGRFAIHQFGHMHAEEMLGRTFAGGPLQRLFQGPSLFGLEHYGHDQNEDRRHGYSACSLTFDDDQITLQRWPRKAVRDSVNGWRFIADNEGSILTGEATQPEIIRQRTPSPNESPSPIVIAKDRTPQLLAAWHTHTQQQWKKHWLDGNSPEKPPYIETQSLRLLLESDRPERFLHPQYFRVGRGPRSVTPDEDRGEWGEIDRGELVRNELGSVDGPRCELTRVVITTASVGKTTTMQWLQAQFNQPGASTAAFFLTFSHLPAQLDELLPDLARRMLLAESDAATSKDDALRAVEALRREGRLVLLLDALDQEPAEGAAAVLVGQLLDDPAWRKCRIVISGRPHAIQRHWTQLFATDAGHGWQFVQVDEFTPEEQRRFLGSDGDGKDRLDLIPEEAREILSSPRVLSYLRGLPDTDLHRIRSVGDVYWHSIQHLLIEGMQGSDAARRIGLEMAEPTPKKVQARSKIRAEKLLAAIAFEMTSTQVSRADAVVGDPSSIPNFDGVPRNRFQKFRERLLHRLSPDAVTDGTRASLDRDLDGLAALNNFIGQGFFDTTVEGMKELFWRNRSLQEFFTALWLSQYGTADDAALLWDWLDLPDQPETEEYYWIWRFVCAMHPDARDPESWLQAVEPVYRPGDGTIVGTRRSCEFVYRAWEPLQKLVSAGEPAAVALRDRFCGEFEAEILSGNRGEQLRQIARQFCDSLIDVPAGEFQMGAPPEKQGIGEELRQRWKEHLEQEGDPEERARRHISNWSFTPGKRGEQERDYWINWYTEVFRDKDLDRIESQMYAKDETPLESIQQVDAFRLSRYPTLNAWYRLFSPGHGEVESSYLAKYRQISPTPDSPVIFVSWYDAWAFTLWARWDGHSCRLPREYEWEYAAKAGTPWDQNYWWGDAFEADKCNADRNVGRTTPPSAAHANPWQFEDFLGNVWEWCEDWYRAAYDRNALGDAADRVVRGGSWDNASSNNRTTSRNRRSPTLTEFSIGFRVASITELATLPAGHAALDDARNLVAQGKYLEARRRISEIPTDQYSLWDGIQSELGFVFDFTLDEQTDSRKWLERREEVEWRRKVWAAMGTAAPIALRTEGVDVGPADFNSAADSTTDENTMSEAESATRVTSPKAILNESSERKGEALEKDTLRLLRRLFEFNDSDVELKKLRQQSRGAQFGCDIKVQYCRAANNCDVRCLVECKSHERELPFKDLLEKLYDAKKRHLDIDHWILIAPRAHLVGNVPDGQIEEWNLTQEFPFVVQLWTSDTDVREIFGLEPTLYDRWIDHRNDEEHPRHWSQERQMQIRDKWLRRLAPPLRLPQSWARYMSVQGEDSLFIENDNRADLKELWHDNRYISPRALDANRSSLTTDLMDAACEWIDDDSPRTCLLLADFGSGKTAFTYMLARRLIREFRENPKQGWIPVRFSLREFSRPRFNSHEFLRNRLEFVGSSVSEWHRLLEEKKRVLVILDGLDEMTTSLTAAAAVRVAIDLLADCCNHQFANAPKVMITSRAPFFEELTQRSYVEEKLGHPRIIYVDRFHKQEVKDKLREQAKTPNEKKLVDELSKTYDVLGAAEKPLFFKMVSDVLSVPGADFSSETAIYDTFIRNSITRDKKAELLEQVGCQDASGSQLVNRMITILEEMAMRVHEEHKNYICLKGFADSPAGKELAQLLWKTVEGDSDTREDAVNRVGVRSLLHKKTQGVDAEDRNSWPVEFCHRSFYEYFVARRIEGTLRGGVAEALTLLKTLEYNHEIRGFAAELMKRSQHDYSQTLRELALLSRCELNQGEEGEDQKHQTRLGRSAVELLFKWKGQLIWDDWSHLTLDGADLAGADLSGKDFRFTSLRSANLNNCKLTDADFRNADVTGARIEQTGQVCALAVPSNESGFFAAYQDGSVRRWTMDTRSEESSRMVYQCTDTIRGPMRLFSSPGDGMCLQVSDRLIFLNRTGEEFREASRFKTQNPCLHAVLKKHGLMLLENRNEDDFCIRMFDFSPQGVPTLEQLAVKPCLYCDSVGRHAVAVALDEGRLVIYSRTAETQFQEIAKLTGISVVATTPSQGPDFLVGCATRDGTVGLWQLQFSESNNEVSFSEVFRKRIHEASVTAICFVGQGKLLTGAMDRRIYAIDISDRRKAPTIEGSFELTIQCKGMRISCLKGRVEKSILIAAGASDE